MYLKLTLSNEIMEFINSRKGDKYSTLLPLLGLHGLEIAAVNLKQLSSEIEQQSHLEMKRGVIKERIAKRCSIFGEDSDVEIENKIADLHTKYFPKSETSEVLARCNELKVKLDQVISQLSIEGIRNQTFKTISALNIEEEISAIRDLNSTLSESVSHNIIEKLGVLESVQKYSEKLDNSEILECPACGQEIEVKSFKDHVINENQSLKETIGIFDKRKGTINSLIDNIKLIKTMLSKDEVNDWLEELKNGAQKCNLEFIEQFDIESLRQSLTEDTLKNIEQNYLPIIESAKNIVQNNPTTDDSGDNKNLVETAKLIFESKPIAEEISKTESLIRFIKSIEEGVRIEIRQKAQAIVKDISSDINALWIKLYPGQPIKNIHLCLPTANKAIDIALTFYDKPQNSPRITLSEGFRSGLGLCIFLAMAKRKGHNSPLFLDDIVNAIDRGYRGMIAQLLEEEFASRQVVIFTQDRDWYAELRKQLPENKWGFESLKPYETPSLGIRFSKNISNFDDARALLKDRPDSAVADARKIIDTQLSLFSEKLEIKLPYRRGERNDLRTNNDFLNRLIADGKKLFKINDVVSDMELLTRAQNLLNSWGNRSAHTFDCEKNEAELLINVCEEALEMFKCTSCKRQVWFAPTDKWFQCGCSNLKWVR